MVDIPDNPILPKQANITDRRVLIFVISVAIASAFFVESDSDIYIYVLLLLIPYNVYKYFSIEAEKSSAKNQYKVALSFYREERDRYEKLKSLRTTIEKYVREEEAEMAKVLVLHKLYRYKEVILINSDSSNVKEGVSEKQFLIQLAKAFNDKLLVLKGIKTRGVSRTYYPDFIYYDNIRQIYIDIEIDEPYDLLEGNPIHYIGADEKRNLFFNSINWCVLRFSEWQVVKQPESCVKTISSIVEFLEGKIPNAMNYVRRDKHWNEEEAAQMMKEGYRESYLGIEKIDRSSPLQSDRGTHGYAGLFSWDSNDTEEDVI